MVWLKLFQVNDIMNVDVAMLIECLHVYPIYHLCMYIYNVIFVICNFVCGEEGNDEVVEVVESIINY